MSTVKFDTLFIPTLGGLIAIYLAIFVYYVGATIVTVPYLDLLEWILRYDQYWRAGDWWHYLWLPHNEHRPIWSLLLVLADIEWFRGTTLPFILFDSFCFVLTIGGLVWVIWRADLAVEVRAILAAAVILLIAGSQAVIYCGLPILSNNIHTVALLILALVLLDSDSEEGSHPTLRRTAAIAAAVGAAFGIIGGLFAPLVLMWVAWAGGLGRAWLIAIGLIAAILFACFLPGIPTGQASHLSDWSALPMVAEYYIRVLGLPWSHAASLVWFGRLAGCVVLGASIITLFRCGLRGRRLRQVERIGFALLMFGLLITAMIALGRWSVLPEQPVPIRYGIYVALGEAGLVLANTPWLERVWQNGRRRTFQWAMLAATALLLVQQVVAGQAAIVVTSEYKNSYREFVAGESTATDPPVFLERRPYQSERVLGIIRSLGIYQN